MFHGETLRNIMRQERAESAKGGEMTLPDAFGKLAGMAFTILANGHAEPDGTVNGRLDHNAVLKQWEERMKMTPDQTKDCLDLVVPFLQALRQEAGNK